MSDKCSKSFQLTVNSFPRCNCGDPNPSPLRPAITGYSASMFNVCECTPDAGAEWDGIIRNGDFAPFTGCNYFQNGVVINGCKYDVVLSAGLGVWFLEIMEFLTTDRLWQGSKAGGDTCVAPTGKYVKFGGCSSPATITIGSAVP